MEGPLPFDSLLAGTDGCIVHDKVPGYWRSFQNWMVQGGGKPFEFTYVILVQSMYTYM